MSTMRGIDPNRLLLWAACLLLLGCADPAADDDSGPPGDDDDTTSEADDDDTTAGDDDDTVESNGCPGNCDCAPVADQFGEMFLVVLNHLIDEESATDGDWDGDFGDATAYAPPVLIEYGLYSDNADLVAAGQATVDHELALIEGFSWDQWELLHEMVVGVAGLIEVQALQPDPRIPAALDDLFTTLVDPLMEGFGYYIPADQVPVGGGYGSTALTALVAGLFLQYVMLVDPGDEERLALALTIIEAIREQAWHEDGYFRHDPTSTTLKLYPNAAMIWVLASAHSATGGQGDYLEQAEALVDALEPLYLESDGVYAYADDVQYDGYMSLSSNNYLSMAFTALCEASGDCTHLDRAVEAMDFAQRELYEDGIVYHHWQLGDRADTYCTGCNFQLLYVLLKMGVV
jgi:hypothetical protein